MTRHSNDVKILLGK